MSSSIPTPRNSPENQPSEPSPSSSPWDEIRKISLSTPPGPDGFAVWLIENLASQCEYGNACPLFGLYHYHYMTDGA